MRKKSLVAFLALAMGTVMIVGNGAVSVSAEESSDGKVHIKWLAADNGSGAHQALVDAFNASQNEIVVDWATAPKKSDDQKQQLLTSLSAGSSEYDVLLMDCCWTADLASSGYLEALDEYMMNSGLNIADFNPGTIQANTYSAKLYGLPLYTDVASLCVRNDIVSEEDLAVLVSGDYSFRDLMDMAAKYAGEGDAKYGLAVQANQYEGLICNVNEWTSHFTNLEEGLANFKEAVTSDYTSDKQLSMVEGDGVDLITSGQAVMYRGWSSTYRNFTEETAVGPDQITACCLPNEGGACLGGQELGININSEKKDAAWKFLQYAAAGEGNVTFCTTGNNISGYIPNTQDEEIVASHQLLSKEGFQNSLKIAIARPSVERYGELSDSLQVAIHSYLSDETSLEDTAASVQELLDEYGFQAE